VYRPYKREIREREREREREQAMIRNNVYVCCLKRIAQRGLILAWKHKKRKRKQIGVRNKSSVKRIT